MNMKRSLLTSFCAIAIVAMTISQSMAAITLSLNLRYTYPGNTALGGNWDLMAKTDSAFGIASIVAVLDNVNLSGITLNNNTNLIGAIPLESHQVSGTLATGIVELVYGQDLSGTDPQVLNVGRGATTPGNIAEDDLFGTSGTTYDNFALIASGTFGAERPAWVMPGNSLGVPDLESTAANEYTNVGMTAVTPADVALTLGGTDGVRGDSVAVDGLKPGDVNRDGAVDTNDLIPVLNSFFTAQSGWDNGDVNGNDGQVDTNDLIDVLNNFFTSAPNPAVTAVPEPATFALLGLAGAALGLVRRRS
jgi:hypothetical protein